MSKSVFHRRSAAKAMSSYIASDRASSGLFLAAPRRTGKTTFIREDLMPALAWRGFEVIYVDLWSDRSSDPGSLIADAVRQRMKEKGGKLSQWLKDNIDLRKFSGTVGPVNLGIDVGSDQPKNASLSDGLLLLASETKSMIVLIIDEAQQALTSADGNNSLFSLKSVRDRLNINNETGNGFRLIATGSNRDKLSVMVNSKDQAFYCAKLSDLPTLGDDYLEWERDRLIADGFIAPSLPTMKSAFQSCGHLPENLSQAMDSLALNMNATQENIDAILIAEIAGLVDAAKTEFFRQVNALPALQMGVLMTMAADGESFIPYSAESAAKYKTICESYVDSHVSIESSSIKYALDALRDKMLIWSSSRGVYSIDDPQHAAWLTEKRMGHGYKTPRG